MQIKAKKLDSKYITVSLEMIHPEIRRIELMNLIELMNFSCSKLRLKWSLGTNKEQIKWFIAVVLIKMCISYPEVNIDGFLESFSEHFVH